MCQKTPHKITLEKRAKNILPEIKIQQIIVCQTLTNKTLGFSLQTIFPFKLSLFCEQGCPRDFLGMLLHLKNGGEFTRANALVIR